MSASSTGPPQPACTDRSSGRSKHPADLRRPRGRAALLAHPPTPVDDSPTGSLEQPADSTSARVNHPAVPLLLSHSDRNTLTKWAHSTTAPYRAVTRTKALLMAGDRVANMRIATSLNISWPTALKWRARFLSDDSNRWERSGSDAAGNCGPPTANLCRGTR